jgi:hypothetical protein
VAELERQRAVLRTPWIPLRKHPRGSTTQWSQKWKSSVLNLHILLLSHEAALPKCASGRKIFAMRRRNQALTSRAGQRVKSPSTTLPNAIRAIPGVESNPQATFPIATVRKSTGPIGRRLVLVEKHSDPAYECGCIFRHTLLRFLKGPSGCPLHSLDEPCRRVR